MKWPAYINVQRKRKVLRQRLKMPAPVAQFTRAADKSLTNAVFKLLEKNKPMTKAVSYDLKNG